MRLKTMLALALSAALSITGVASADSATSSQNSQVAIDESAIIGKWQLDEYSENGLDYSEQDIADRAETIELMQNSMARHTLHGESEDGKWSESGGIIALHTNAIDYSLKFDENRLELQGDGISGSFIRDTSSLNALKFSDEQAQAMSNLINGGMFAIKGDELFGLNWNATGQAMLAAKTLTGDSEVAGETRALDENCVPGYINIVNDKLYYIRNGSDGDSGIYSMSTSGENRVKLLDGTFGSLQVVGQRMYYTDAEHKLNSCALDGGDIQKVMNFKAYFPYVMSDEWLIYQNDDDAETLHAYRFADGYDKSLTDTRSYLPMLKDNYLYFFEKTYDADNAKAERASICRMDMTTLKLERAAGFSGAYLALNSKYMFAANGYKLGKFEAWWTIENTAYDELDKAPIFANDDYLVSLIYNNGEVANIEVERLDDRSSISYNN